MSEWLPTVPNLLAIFYLEDLFTDSSQLIKILANIDYLVFSSKDIWIFIGAALESKKHSDNGLLGTVIKIKKVYLFIYLFF